MQALHDWGLSEAIGDLFSGNWAVTACADTTLIVFDWDKKSSFVKNTP